MSYVELLDLCELLSVERRRKKLVVWATTGRIVSYDMLSRLLTKLKM